MFLKVSRASHASVQHTMRSVVMLVGVLGVVSASPKIPNNLKFINNNEMGRNDALQAVIDNLLIVVREIIYSGSGNVPVLDPWSITNLDLDLGAIGIDNSHVALRNGRVDGLGTFDVVSQDLRLSSLFPLRFILDLDIEIPELNFEAEEYNLEITLLGFRVFGSGNLKLKITRPSIHAELLLAPSFSGGIFIHVDNLSLKVGLAAFQSSITGLFDNEDASSFVSNFLSHLVPELVESYKTEITEFVSPIAQNAINEILDGLNLADLRTVMELHRLRYH